jgi:signal transduction histidine kinase
MFISFGNIRFMELFSSITIHQAVFYKLKCSPIFFFFLFSGLIGYSADNTQIPPGLRQDVVDIMNEATIYMNASDYEKAQAILGTVFTTPKFSLNDYELYYIHCYESEILYYNALFDLGLNSALRARELAVTLQNDTLIGSADNLCGLFYMNLNRPDEARPYFFEAKNKIPTGHNREYLSYQYHALSNLAECFLKLEIPDSAIYYSELARTEPQQLNRIRGIAIIEWNLGEAFLLKNETETALSYLRSGLKIIANSPHVDVNQMLVGTMMKVFSARSQTDSLLTYLQMGLQLNENELNTDYSRLEFLKNSASLCLKNQLNTEANMLLQRWAEQQQKAFSGQQGQQLLILQQFFENNQNLLIANQKAELNQKELSNQRYVIIIGSILLVALLIISYIGYQILKQKQKLTELRHQQEIGDKEKQMELDSLKKRMESLFEERNRIAADLHDDIGAALSSIRIYSGAALQLQIQRPDEVERLLTKINGNSSEMMEAMSDIIWAISSKNDHGENLILRMRTHASDFLEPTGIQWKLEAEKGLYDLRIKQEIRRTIYLIFKEALHNCVKHACATHISIKLSQRGQLFVMEISDNGKGFDLSQIKEGNGIRNLNNRAEGVNGKIEWKVLPNEGTTILFSCDITRFSD